MKRVIVDTITTSTQLDSYCVVVVTIILRSDRSNSPRWILHDVEAAERVDRSARCFDECSASIEQTRPRLEQFLILHQNIT